MFSRRRFIAIAATVIASTRTTVAQTPDAIPDPLDGAINMARRTIGTGFDKPDAAFDMAAETGEHYFPEFTFGVTVYGTEAQATWAFDYWSDQFATNPGEHYNENGDLVPRVARTPIEVELDADQVDAWSQPWETSDLASAEFSAITLLVRQGRTVHLWQVTPGKSGDYGPVDDMLTTIAPDWFAGIDGTKPSYDRDDLFAMLPGEDQIATLPGFWRTFVVDEDYGETNP